MSEPLQISVHVEEKRYQPTQEKTVVPGWDAKTVTPDRGYALSKVTVEGMPEPTETETFTENGEYNVGRIGTAIVDVGIDLQNKTVTPTEQTQTVEADQGYDGLDTVTVNPIPPEYVVPSGSVDITANGQISVSGKATANVNVPGIIPTGTKQISITANGTTTEDVSEYADAEITVNTLPAKGLVFEDYDADGFPHSARLYWTDGDTPSSYLYGLGTDGCGKYVKTITIPPGITIGSYFLYNAKVEIINMPHSSVVCAMYCFRNTPIVDFVFYGNVEFQGNSHFMGCTKLETIEFGGYVNVIPVDTFRFCDKLSLIDFSHCTAIPPLYSVASLGHASGCVIRIPAALSDTTLGEGNGWESATNWSALTDIVWEVV